MKFLSILLFLSVFTANTLFAQWVQTNGPLGGVLNAIEQVGNEIWVASNGGIYVSQDNGFSWNLREDLGRKRRYLDIMAYNDTVFMVYNNLNQDNIINGKTYFINSFDNGNSWSQPIEIRILNQHYYSYYCKLYKINNGIALVSSDPWALISKDNGITWNQINIPNNVNAILGYAFFINNSLIIEAYSSSSSTLQYWYLNDANANLSFIDSNSFSFTSAVVDSFLFVTNYLRIDSITEHSKILRRKINEPNWDTIHNTNFPIHSFGFHNGELYINPSSDSSYKSADYGITWQKTNYNKLYYIYDSVLINNSTGIGISGLNYTNSLLRYSLPNHSPAFFINTGIIANDIYRLYANNNRIFSFNTSGEMFASDDFGNEWYKLNTPGLKANEMIFFQDTVFCLFNNESDVNIFLGYSLDNGISWQVIPNNFINSGSFYPSNRPSLCKLNNHIYIGADSIWRADKSNLLTWENLSHFPIVDTIPNPRINKFQTNEACVRSHNNEILVVTERGQIYRLNNVDNTWEFKEHIYTPGAHTNNRMFDLGNHLVVRHSNHFIVSNDSGNTWYSPANNGLPFNGSDVIYPSGLINYNGLWIGYCYLNGIYMSADYGETWQPFDANNPLPTEAVGQLAMINNVLFTGTRYNGVWRRLGNFESYTGNVFRDYNNNGIKDSIDYNLPNINISSKPVYYFTNTNSLGNYTILSDANNDSIKVQLPNNFSSSKPAFHLTSNGNTNLDFGVYLTPNIPDLAIDITNAGVFRPGFDNQLFVTVRNNGTKVQPASLEITIDTTIDIVSVSDNNALVLNNVITLSTDSLDFLEFYTFSITVNPQLILIPGIDSVSCIAKVFPIIDDTFKSNNIFVLKEAVVGSYDPNDKQCAQGRFFTPAQLENNEEIIFTIRFQNTGNYQADFIRIADTISSYLDLASFRVISSSHEMSYKIEGRTVNFKFDDIFLPPQSESELNSQGFVKYGIKCISTASLGDAITNTAYIYFDFNPPIITNTTSTLIAEPEINTSVKVYNKNNIINLSIFPNPTKNELNIVADNNINGAFLEVYDVLGSKIKSEFIVGSKFLLNTSLLNSGMYWGCIKNKKNEVSAIFRFLVQQ